MGPPAATDAILAQAAQLISKRFATRLKASVRKLSYYFEYIQHL